MKRLSVFLLAAMFFSACKKDDTALFVIPVTNLSFEVNPSMSAFNSHDIPINGVNFNALNILAGKGIDTSTIKNIRPRSARIYIPFANNNLDFIKEIAIRLCQPGDNRPNCGQEAFWFNEDLQRDKGAEHVLFGSNVNDLREFVLTENINIQVQLDELWRSPDGTFEIFLDMEFDVR
ncbi:MAG: hypothetical protein R2825_17890 [Saprospiraceae bacterium]